ncbi:hypothetical protein ACN47E_005797 [Coniothyrium glycines]
MPTVLRDVIAKRKECLAFYRIKVVKQDDDAKARGKGHEFCIAIFEDVLAILAAREVKVHHPPVAAKTSGSVNLENNFASLCLERPEDEDDEDDDVSTFHTHSGADTFRPKDEYELETLAEDAELALFCFLKDATGIRLFIRRTWRLYRAATVSLEVAAIVMNVGISLIKSMNETLFTTHPNFSEFKQHEDICHFLLDRLCDSARTQGPNDMENCYESYIDEAQTLDYNRLMYIHTQSLILVFLKAVCPKDGFPRIQDNGIPFPRAEAKFSRTLVQLALLCQTGVQGMPDDMVLQAISGIVFQDACPSWAVFALQCIQDTQEELGDSMLDCLKALQHTAAPMLITLPLYGVCRQQHGRIGQWHSKYESEIKD